MTSNTEGPKSVHRGYSTIVADPPWHYDRTGVTFEAPQGGAFKGTGLPYGTMTLDDIAALPIDALAAPDAHLYLWTTQRYLEDALGMIGEWGFSRSCVLVWCKPIRGWTVGGTFMSTVEFCIFARRGKLPALTRHDTQWFELPRGAHSAKPEAFMDIVESVSPGPYLEMFSRRARLGWSTWGNESLEGGAA